MAVSDRSRVSLCELLDRVLNTGVVVLGDVLITVAGVELVYVNLQLLVTSVETARKGRIPLQQSVESISLEQSA